MEIPTLNDEGLKELVNKPIVAKLATTSAKGEIRITPIWFGSEDGSFVFNTFEDSGVVRTLTGSPTCSLLIDTTDWPYIGVHYWGTATVEGPENDAEGMGTLYTGYVGGEEAAQEYAKQLISWGKRVYVRFRPDRSTTWDFRGG
jgi:hypothetical protein